MKKIEHMTNSNSMKIFCLSVYLRKGNIVFLERAPAFTVALVSKQCEEEESIVFTCEVNKAGVAVTWKKDGMRILPAEGIRIESQGRLHSLIIDRALLSTTGTYTARIDKGVETSAQLLVLGMPFNRFVSIFYSFLRIFLSIN